MKTPVRIPCDRHTLDNGLRVVISPDDSLPLVAVNLWYHVGSRHDPLGRTGLAHLFEHMLFQGSEHVGANEHFHYVQQVGGVANGSTWFDRTNYYETLPAHHLELGLWLESDRLGWFLSGVTRETLETQRRVVLNERLQRVDNQPYGAALERLHERLYPLPHPYHWPVIGYADDIAATDLEDVRSFFSTYYAPGNAVLTLVGDLETSAAIDLIERYFGDIPARDLSSATAPEAAPAPTAGTAQTIASAPKAGTAPAEKATAAEATIEDDVQLPRLYFGFTVPGYGTDDWYAAQVLATTLTGGRSSPLHHDLVYRREIARDVSATVFPTQLGATFLMVATARPDGDVDELRRLLEEHLRRAAEELLPAAQIERARNQITTALHDRLQSVGQRADLLGRATTFFDEPERVSDEADSYLASGLDDLRRLAADSLGTDRQTTVTVLPRPSRRAAAEDPAEPDLPAKGDR